MFADIRNQPETTVEAGNFSMIVVDSSAQLCGNNFGI